MKNKYFTYAETPDLSRCIIIPINYETFPLNTKNGGSYNVAPARVLGLDYVTYLRFIRNLFPDIVTLEGKEKKYVVPYWKKGKELFTFIDLLNNKMELAMNENRRRNSV